jgi:hypothetical protein
MLHCGGILVGQLSQPGTSCNISSRDRRKPNVVNELAPVPNWYGIHPSKYITQYLKKSPYRSPPSLLTCRVISFFLNTVNDIAKHLENGQRAACAATTNNKKMEWDRQYQSRLGGGRNYYAHKHGALGSSWHCFWIYLDLRFFQRAGGQLPQRSKIGLTRR